MADGSLARRYARALVGIAQEERALDQMALQLMQFEVVLDRAAPEMAGRTLRTVLDNPGLTHGERQAVLAQVLGRLSLHPMVSNFLRLVLDKNRFGVLPEITREYIAMADSLSGRVRGTVTTSQSLSPSMADSVRAALTAATGKEVIIQFVVDPGLIGGMVAKVGDTVYDASVKGRLLELQQVLSSSSGQVAEA
jgi:F-type H+-transporting ATPase subunit delta